MVSMVLEEFQAWTVFTSAVILPLTTLGAAAIAATGTVVATALIADMAKNVIGQAMTGQTEVQKLLVERVPRPKFF
jgi:hypothetical protein